LWVFVLAFGPGIAVAADTQSYVVDLGTTGSAEMDETLAATSDLQNLGDRAPVSPFGLIARARSDRERLKTVLESYGYYQSRVLISIDGTEIDNVLLGETLGKLPAGAKARVAVRFDLGPLYHVRRVQIDGAIPASARESLGLATGDPAVAAQVLNAGNRLLNALHEQGYAFARVDAPIAYEDATDPVLDITYHVATGDAVKIGEIRFAGMKRVRESALRKRLLLHTGQEYSSSAVERARKDLLSLGVLAGINVRLGTEVDATGGVPITFDVKERARHALSFTGAYSSDLGGSVGSTWTDRDLLGGAQQLSVTGTVIGLGGSAITALGYNTSIKYLIPDFAARDQSLQFAVGAIKQSLQAYDQKAVTAGVTLARKLSSIWSASIGVAAAKEQITQQALTSAVGQAHGLALVEPFRTDYTLLMLPLTLSYDSTDLASPLDDPLHGMRDSISVTPTRSIGANDATFVITQLKFSGYVDIGSLFRGTAGRSVLALRGLAGIAEGATELSLPPDQRFYGGGSNTIRGYEYQSVGPIFNCPANLPPTVSCSQTPIGGTAIVAGTVEFRQRFGKSWGSALFVDGGQVSDSLRLQPDIFRIGVGAGVRYYTPIGPIRVDFAVPLHTGNVPLSQTYDEQRFQIYIGLGQAF
jgi:translocation and assembly module TamA